MVNRVKTVWAGFVFGVVLLAGVWVSLAAKAQAAGGVGGVGSDIAERLPSGTLFYISFTGTKNVSAYGQSHTAAIYGSKEIKELWTKGIPKIKQLIKQNEPGNEEGLRAVEVLETMLPSLLENGGAFYLASLDVSGPRAGLVLRVQGEAKGKAIFDKFGPEMLRAVERSNARLREVEDLLVMGFGYPAEDPVLSDKVAESLAELPGYKQTFTGMKLEPLVKVYVNVRGVHRALSELSDFPEAENLQEYPMVSQVIGLDTLESVAVGAGIAGKNWRTEGVIRGVPTGAIGILLDQGKVDAGIFKAIPATATTASVGAMDLNSTVERVRGLLQDVNPQAAQQMDGMIGLVSQTLGTDVMKEVLPHLGNTWAVYQDPQTLGSPLLGVVVINKLKDPTAAAAGIDKLGKGLHTTLMSFSKQPGPQFGFRKGEMDGVSFRSSSLPLVSPTVVVKGDYLIVSTYTQLAVGAAKWLDSGAKDITSADAFADVKKRLAAGEGGSMTFVDLPRVAPSGYGVVVTLAQGVVGAGDLFGVSASPAIIPAYYQLAPRLSATGSAVWKEEGDAGGIRFVSETPFPGAEILGANITDIAVGQAALATSILLPSLNRARETANRVKCASNMRQIGQALTLFANDNRGRYPNTLGEMAVAQDMWWTVFSCPSNTDITPGDEIFGDPAKLAEWVNENSHYELVVRGTDGSNDLPPDVMVMIERDTAHDGDGRNVLFGDGHVEFIPMRSWEKAKQTSDEALEKHLLARGKR